ncbi:MAG: hypothetical protein R2681_04280 [Pyrinomonadaceae bacterium]
MNRQLPGYKTLLLRGVMLSIISIIAADTSLSQAVKMSGDLPNPYRIIQKYVSENNYLTPLLELKAKENDYLSSPMRPLYLERMTVLESFVSNYREAYKYEDMFLADLPSAKSEREQNSAELSDSPLKNYDAMDAVKSISAIAENEQVIMINEEHRTPFHRAFTEMLLSDLYKHGFRYFAAEALSSSDIDLNKRGYPIQATGFYTDDPVFAGLIRTAIKTGFKVVAYEYEERCDPREEDPFFCQEVREKGQAQNIYDRILKNDRDAKILVHAGRGHNAKSSFKEFSFMAWHFEKISKIEPFTIDQLEYSERFNRTHENPLYRYLTGRGLLEKPMVFKNVDGEFYGRSTGYDMRIFHPRMKFENGRAAFLKMNGSKKPVRIQVQRLEPEIRSAIFDEKEPLLIQAFFKDDSADAVPTDQIIIYSGEKIPPLMLPKGDFRIRIIDKTGKVLKVYMQRL